MKKDNGLNSKSKQTSQAKNNQVPETDGQRHPNNIGPTDQSGQGDQATLKFNYEKSRKVTWRGRQITRGWRQSRNPTIEEEPLKEILLLDTNIRGLN